jgi:hypothetical protein
MQLLGRGLSSLDVRAVPAVLASGAAVLVGCAGVGSGGEPASTPAHTTPSVALTFQFDESGRVRQDYCMFEHVAVHPGLVTFDHWISTLQTCPTLPFEQERFLLSILSGTANWEMRGRELEVSQGPRDGGVSAPWRVTWTVTPR